MLTPFFADPHTMWRNPIELTVSQVVSASDSGWNESPKLEIVEVSAICYMGQRYLGLPG